MSTGYRKAIRKYAPDGIEVVHDKYHLVSSMNDTVDAIRRHEQRRLEDEDKQVIKGTRYLLLYGEEKLNEPSPDKIARLEKVLEANERIQKAYLLKEEFRRFWDQPSKRAAELFLSNWVLEALSVGNQHLTNVVVDKIGAQIAVTVRHVWIGANVRTHSMKTTRCRRRRGFRHGRWGTRSC